MNRITLTEPIMNFRAFSTLTLLVPLALAVACGDKGTASETDQTTSVDTESGSESESGESETDPAETEGTTGGTDITGTQTGSSTTGETESTDGCLVFNTAMGSMEVVSMRPVMEACGSLV